MRPRVPIIAAAPLVLLALAGAPALGASGDTPQIVLLDPGTNAPAKAAAEEHRGNDVTAVYSTAIDGFAAQLSPADIARLQADPSVKSIEPDARVTIQAAPGNDLFANATSVSGASGTVSGTTAQATRETGEPTPTAQVPAWTTSRGKSIWYAWTAPTTGTATITTAGSAFDTMLAVYAYAPVTGNTGFGALTVLAANDDITGGTTSSVSLPVTAGTTYRIVVDGWNNASGTTKLNWSVAAAAAPANDNFTSAQDITNTVSPVAVSTANATRQSGEPDHGGSGVAHSVWYRWQAPGTRNYTFSTSNSTFTTALGVYTGGAVNSLTAVTPVGTRSGNQITFAATSGTTYYVAVDGQSGGMGTTNLGWAQAAPSVTVPGAPGWGTPALDVAGIGATAHLTPPASDGGAPVTRYTVVCSASGGTTVSANAATTTISLAGFTAGRTYNCTAYATNSAGTSAGTATAAFVAPTVPGSPTAVTATPKDGAAVVAWTAPTEDARAPITSYIVTASGAPTRQCNTTGATTCTVTGLTNGTSYTFSVRAGNAVGLGTPSAPSTAVTPKAPVIAPPADPAPAPSPSPTPTDPTTPTEPAPVTGPGLPQSREALSWGVDRLDERARALDGRFNAPLDGTGVTAYVVDTGVLADHEEFTGRVVGGVDQVGDGNGTNDCNGHGTHVAGTIAGAGYGVAPLARIAPVRVLGCDGSGSVSDVIAGLDWIARTHQPGQAAVANLSMGTPSSAALNAAVDRAVADGVTVTVAAGNENADACDMSPANDAQAITVGATDDTDARASFSDYGSCVTVFAPGVDIESAWNTGTKDIEALSGTSMAAPHAAGVAALLLSGTPGASPAQVKQAITEAATSGVVGHAGTGSPNLLLFGASTTVPQLGASSNNGGQSAHQVAKPKAPKVKKVTRNAKGRLVITLTAEKGATVKVYAGKVVLKTATAPATGKAFTITVTKKVRKGTKITLRAINSGGASPATKVVRAP